MRRFGFVPVLVALALCAAADTVVPRGGQPVEGKVLQDDANEVVVNPYFSKFKEMVWKVAKFDKRAVARVDIAPENPLHAYWGKAAGLKADDAKGALEIAAWCKEKKLEAEAKEMASWALAADPDNAEAKALLGADAEKLLKSSPRHNKELRLRIADYAALPVEERKAAYEAIKKEFAVKEPREWFDRVARSSAQPKGFRKEVKLTLRSEKVTGVYCIHVPEDYDPIRPFPLVIGLHGGGPAGKDGKGVVGSGPEFYPFLDTNAGRRGYIAACPTAISAPWRSPDNDALFTTLLQELCILYNVDLTRVYLIGHSMGGFGTWHFGPLYCEKFAAIAPASGGGHNGEHKLAEHGTAVYVYHSDDDPRCAVEPDREAADLLKKAKADFVYTELPGKDHSWPAEIVDDTFDMFDRRRLMTRQGKSLSPPRAPRSSFLEKLTPEEVRSFPLAASGGGGADELKNLLVELSRGGANGEAAAKKIAALGRKTATPALVNLLSDPKTTPDVKGLAAFTIGELKDPKGLAALSAALGDDSLKVRAAAATALGSLGEIKGAAAVATALEALGKYFDSRMQGDVIDLTDWEAIQALNATYVEALGRLGDPKTATPVSIVALRKILLSRVSVDFDRQVQDGPEPSRRAAASRIIPALPGLKEPTLKVDLTRLREAFKDHGDILQLCDDAEKGM
jgi:hypothetical protein